MSQPVIPPTPQLTGPLLLGHFFNWGLFGTLTVQAYVYYLAFPRDPMIPKMVVAFIYTLELLQTVLSTRDAFRAFGTGWGDLNQVDEVGWLWFSVPVLGSLISCTGQLFYAWRIYVLSKRLSLAGIVALLACVQAGFGIYSGVHAHELGRFSQLQFHSYTNIIIWLGGSALCDSILAACMIYYLQRAKTGFRTTTTLLSKFIRITVETGLTCAIFAILDLSLDLAFKKNNYHLAPSIALSKIYANSLLVVLNVRVRIVGGRNDDHVSQPAITIGSTTVDNLSERYPGEVSRKMNTPISVTISKSQVTANDNMELECIPSGDGVKYNAEAFERI